MPLEVDHVFICCSSGAPAAEALVRLGLREGSPNTHPGQGTANRRFFFGNAFLDKLRRRAEVLVRSPARFAPAVSWRRARAEMLDKIVCMRNNLNAATD
jgi:Glyoxalase-like domain